MAAKLIVPYQGAYLWAVLYNLTEAELKNETSGSEGFLASGFRLVSIGAYGAHPNIRYVTVWNDAPGPSQTIAIAKPEGEIVDITEQKAATGQFPSMVAAYGAGDAARFTTVYEQGALVQDGQRPGMLLTGLSPGGFGVAASFVRKVGGALRWLACYGSLAEPKYAGVFRRYESPFEVAWNFVLAEPALDFAETVGIVGDGFYRTEFLTLTSEHKYAGVFYDNSVGPMGTLIEIDEAELKETLLLNTWNQLFPYRMQAAGPANAPTFAMVLMPTDVATERTFRVHRAKPLKVGKVGSAQQTAKRSVGPPPAARAYAGARALGAPRRLVDERAHERSASQPRAVGGRARTISEGAGGGGPPQTGPKPSTGTTPTPAQHELASVEAFTWWVRKLMKTFNIRGASLAVTKDARLVYAAGFTWAEPDYPDVLPISPCRIYSVSKSITALAAVKLAVEGELDLNANWAGFTQIKTPLGGPPVDAKWSQITIDNLLTHRSGMTLGWNPSLVLDALPPNKKHEPPASPSEVASWTVAQPKVFGAPYGEDLYSNHGYLLVGEAVSAAAKPIYEDYPKYVQEEIFKKLDIPTAAARAYAPLTAPGLAHEMRYHAGLIAAWASEVLPGRPRVPNAYAADNATNAASGGWTMSTVDLVRVLASFDVEVPLVGPKPQASKSLIFPPLAEAILFANYGQPAWNPEGLARSWYWARPWKGLRTVENGGGAPGAYSYILRREDKLCFAMVVNFEYALGREPLVFGPQHQGLNLHDWYGQLNTIADTVNEAGTWPDVDLFPSVGRPPLV